jgi:hypothetical protein
LSLQTRYTTQMSHLIQETTKFKKSLSSYASSFYYPVCQPFCIHDPTTYCLLTVPFPWLSFYPTHSSASPTVGFLMFPWPDSLFHLHLSCKLKRTHSFSHTPDLASSSVYLLEDYPLAWITSPPSFLNSDWLSPPCLPSLWPYINSPLFSTETSTLKMLTMFFSEMLLSTNKSTWCHISEQQYCLFTVQSSLRTRVTNPQT